MYICLYIYIYIYICSGRGWFQVMAAAASIIPAHRKEWMNGIRRKTKVKFC